MKDNIDYVFLDSLRNNTSFKKTSLDLPFYRIWEHLLSLFTLLSESIRLLNLRTFDVGVPWIRANQGYMITL